ncbi:MAG: trypsin-like peptidase domain-containing protein [Candidatus Sumerlaeia bacterium]|nr:trypsin-like peptidase domain-containing protein [Candidatus Sumerlaeia bacterium]
MTAFRTALLTAAALAAAFAGRAQEEQVPSPYDAEARARDRVFVWQLEGGGEVYGRLAKETAEAVFVDIGPEIVRIPLASVAKRLDPSEAEVAAAKVSVADSPGFQAANGAPALGRVETLERAKRSVVLVSNPRGLGSGWVLDGDGRIVTNHHVIGNEKLQTVTVFVPDGKGQWERKRFDDCPVESFSSLYDIAVVRLDPERAKEEGVELQPLPVAEPGTLDAGDPVFAIGNPGMGGRVLEHTISEGIVSSLARNFSDVIYVQTTAAVNPGNSGGPLLNDSGQVVGLITLRAVFQEGIAFALPTSHIQLFLKNSQAFAFSETNQNLGFRYLPPD